MVELFLYFHFQQKQYIFFISFTDLLLGALGAQSPDIIFEGYWKLQQKCVSFQNSALFVHLLYGAELRNCDHLAHNG